MHETHHPIRQRCPALLLCLADFGKSTALERKRGKDANHTSMRVECFGRRLARCASPFETTPSVFPAHRVSPARMIRCNGCHWRQALATAAGGSEAPRPPALARTDGSTTAGRPNASAMTHSALPSTRNVVRSRPPLTFPFSVLVEASVCCKLGRSMHLSADLERTPSRALAFGKLSGRGRCSPRSRDLRWALSGTTARDSPTPSTLDSRKRLPSCRWPPSRPGFLFSR